MKVHDLKIDCCFFSDVTSGRKTFEIRSDDRGFEEGDFLNLKEWTGSKYTGLSHQVKVVYITNYAQQRGYVVMGII